MTLLCCHPLGIGETPLYCLLTCMSLFQHFHIQMHVHPSSWQSCSCALGAYPGTYSGRLGRRTALWLIAWNTFVGTCGAAEGQLCIHCTGDLVFAADLLPLQLAVWHHQMRLDPSVTMRMLAAVSATSASKQHHRNQHRYIKGSRACAEAVQAAWY